jgi:TonB family protein
MRKSLAGLGFAGVVAAMAWAATALAAPPAAPAPAAPAPAPPAPAPQTAMSAADQVLVFYPPAAKAAGVEGAAVIRCGHDEHLAVKDCVLVSETPAGQGFGAAALAMAARAPDNPKLNFPDEAARPPVEVEIRFTLKPPAISPDITRMAHTIGQPAIVTKPTPAQIQAAYPARALDNQIEGDALMDCVVMANGKLTACRIAGESPTGFGFGQAALDLAADYELKPRYIDGEPNSGAQVRLGVRFTTADPTAPLTLGVKPPEPANPHP